MGGHDAASVAAALAGLTEPGKEAPLPPERLAEAFCDRASDGIWSGSAQKAPRGKTYQGFCGFNGSRGGSLTTGFDDGYDFMGYLQDHGWRPMPGKGDWPYVVVLLWPAERRAIAQYCEADLTLWVFEAPEDAKALYAELRDAP